MAPLCFVPGFRTEEADLYARLDHTVARNSPSCQLLLRIFSGDVLVRVHDHLKRNKLPEKFLLRRNKKAQAVGWGGKLEATDGHHLYKPSQTHGELSRTYSTGLVSWGLPVFRNNTLPIRISIAGVDDTSQDNSSRQNSQSPLVAALMRRD